jgi:hypothetical protein
MFVLQVIAPKNFTCKVQPDPSNPFLLDISGIEGALLASQICVMDLIDECEVHEIGCSTYCIFGEHRLISNILRSQSLNQYGLKVSILELAKLIADVSGCGVNVFSCAYQFSAVAKNPTVVEYPSLVTKAEFTSSLKENPNPSSLPIQKTPPDDDHSTEIKSPQKTKKKNIFNFFHHIKHTEHRG